MIKKARFKFIAITMSIVLAVFLTIYTGFAIIMGGATDRLADAKLNDVLDFYLQSETIDENIDIDGRIYPILSNGKISMRSGDYIPQIVLNQIRPGITIKTNNVYYRIIERDSQIFLVEADLSESASVISAITVTTLFVLVSIYVLLFFIVWLLSYSVFKPIKDAFNKQKQFISNASHEMKTPLAIISANVDVLSEKADNKWIQNVKSQTNRMNTMVAEMLELAKLDEGVKKTIKKRVNLSQEITETVLPFDTIAFEKHKTLNLNVEQNIIANVNIDDLIKITSILVDNATKYALSIIDVSLKKDGNKHAVLSVKNDGSLVPDRYANKVFERFYRGDFSRTSNNGGSGLGLSIAKALSNANKWKLEAVSKLNVSMEIKLTISL